MSLFAEKVLKVVKKIPQGKVLTYSQVAIASGSPNAFRAVGSILANNHDKTIPCHRVIKSDGGIGRYNGLRGKSKKEILEKEGVRFSKNGKVTVY